MVLQTLRNTRCKTWMPHPKWCSVQQNDLIWKNWLVEKKDGIRNAIHKKRDQADNFIIDISKSEVTENELNKQIENVFNSYNTQFVDTIMVIKGEDVVKILKRQ